MENLSGTNLRLALRSQPANTITNIKKIRCLIFKKSNSKQCNISSKSDHTEYLVIEQYYLINQRSVQNWNHDLSHIRKCTKISMTCDYSIPLNSYTVQKHIQHNLRQIES